MISARPALHCFHAPLGQMRDRLASVASSLWAHHAPHPACWQSVGRLVSAQHWLLQAQSESAPSLCLPARLPAGPLGPLPSAQCCRPVPPSICQPCASFATATVRSTDSTARGLPAARALPPSQGQQQQGIMVAAAQAPAWGVSAWGRPSRWARWRRQASSPKRCCTGAGAGACCGKCSSSSSSSTCCTATARCAAPPQEAPAARRPRQYCHFPLPTCQPPAPAAYGGLQPVGTMPHSTRGGSRNGRQQR